MLILVWVQLFGQPPKVLSSLIAHHLFHSCDNQIYRGMYKLVYQKHLLLISTNTTIITIIIIIIFVVSAAITGSSGVSKVGASLFLSFIVDGFLHVVIITLTTTTCCCCLRGCRLVMWSLWWLLPITGSLRLLHLYSRLLKELLLLLLVFDVSPDLLLSQLFFPFFTFFLLTFRARQSMKLLGVGDLEYMMLLFAHHAYFGVVEALKDHNPDLSRYLFTGFVEFATLVAPAIVWDSDSLYTLRALLKKAHGNGVDQVSSYKEGVLVLTFKFKGVLPLTNTVGGW